MLEELAIRISQGLATEADFVAIGKVLTENRVRQEVWQAFAQLCATWANRPENKK